MKHKIVIGALLAAMTVPAWAGPVKGWDLTGDGAQSYEIGMDAKETVSGQPSRYIRYVTGDDSHFGTLMQQVSAKNYRGKRVRFQAMIKTRDVSQWAGLWMSAERTGERHAAVIYNSQDRPIAGTTDWQLRRVTLDIPEDVATLNFGVIDAGKGQVWIDQLSVEEVGKEVPVDELPGRRKPALEPSL